MSFHHGHHLRLQLLQFVLMLLLCFLIGSHQVAVWEQREMRMKILSSIEIHTVLTISNQVSKHHFEETGYSASSVRM